MTDIVNITPREMALQRENERLLKALRISSFTVETQAEEIAKLKADAERYRWLRINLDDSLVMYGNVSDAQLMGEEELDAAIDAAMKESKS